MKKLTATLFALALMTTIAIAATWSVTVLVNGQPVYSQGGFPTQGAAEAAGRAVAFKYIKPGASVDIRTSRQGNGEAGKPRRRRR